MSEPDLPTVPDGPGALREADIADVTRRLEERERSASRHTLWAVLGVSPAGLLPLIGTASEFGVAALITGVAAITVVEAVRAIRARGEAARLRSQLEELTAPWTSSSFELEEP